MLAFFIFHLGDKNKMMSELYIILSFLSEKQLQHLDCKQFGSARSHGDMIDQNLIKYKI